MDPGRSQVHDRAHVGAVDAHAEGIGRDHDLECCAVEERALGLLPRVRSQAGVIDARASSRGRASRAASSSAPRRVGAYTMATPCALPGPPSASASTASTWAWRSPRPRPRPRAAAGSGRAKPRTCWGVSAGRPRRPRISSRTTGVAVAVQARTRAGGRSARRPPISRYSGPEVVAPFADAVGLVDGHQRDLDVAQQAAEAREDEPLGGDVDERVLARRPCAPCGGGPRRRRGWRPGTWRSRRAR